MGRRERNGDERKKKKKNVMASNTGDFEEVPAGMGGPGGVPLHKKAKGTFSIGKQKNLSKTEKRDMYRQLLRLPHPRTPPFPLLSTSPLSVCAQTRLCMSCSFLLESSRMGLGERRFPHAPGMFCTLLVSLSLSLVCPVVPSERLTMGKW